MGRGRGTRRRERARARPAPPSAIREIDDRCGTLAIVAVDLAGFLSRLPPGAAEQLGDETALAAALEARWVQARAAWPGVEVPAEAFLAHVADRIDPANPAGWTALLTDDLYVAAGCAAGAPAAIAACQRACQRDIDRGLSSVDAPVAIHDEVTSALYARVFVGTEDAPPAILAFSGRGGLRKWMRVAATRLALNVLRSQHREAPLPETMELADAQDLELGHLRRTYQEAFRAAFADAMGELTAEQRTLLRMHLIDKLSIDDLARLHHVHRTSTARWLREARALLAEGTRRRLHGSLGVGEAELDSIMVLVRSQLDLSLTRLLGGKPPTS